jgi:hypothetical protein
MFCFIQYGDVFLMKNSQGILPFNRALQIKYCSTITLHTLIIFTFWTVIFNATEKTMRYLQYIGLALPLMLAISAMPLQYSKRADSASG